MSKIKYTTLQSLLNELHQAVKEDNRFGKPRYWLNQRYYEDIKEEDKRWILAEVISCNVRQETAFLTLGQCEPYEASENALPPTRHSCQLAARIYNRTLLDDFEAQTGAPLKVGNAYLFHGFMSYHSYYGISLEIHEIHPRYTTLGELEKRIDQIRARVRAERLDKPQKGLELPKDISRIAIISSEQSAGYYDFIVHLGDVQRRYEIESQLFDSIMQGDRAYASICERLNEIESEGNWDLVVIVRGGGNDLFCFNDYRLAKRISECTIPVFTAIGHAQDRLVVTEISHTNCTTPTALVSAIKSLLQSQQCFSRKGQAEKASKRRPRQEIRIKSKEGLEISHKSELKRGSRLVIEFPDGQVTVKVKRLRDKSS